MITPIKEILKKLLRLGWTARHGRVVAWTLALPFVAWLVLSMHEDISNLSIVSLWKSRDLVLIALALSVLNYAVRAVRWRWYLNALGKRLSLGFAVLTYIAGFAFTLSPGKLGEIARVRYCGKANVSVSDVTAAVFVERLIDLIAMSFLAMFIVTSIAGYQELFLGLTMLVSIGLIALRLAPQVARTVSVSKRAPAVLARLGGAVVDALNGASTLLKIRIAGLSFVVSVVAWGAEAVGLFVLGKMVLPESLGVPVAVGIYGIAVLAGVLSFLPGGLGSTEAVMTALIATEGYAVSDALLIALTCRLVTLWFGVSIGWIAVLALECSSPKRGVAA